MSGPAAIAFAAPLFDALGDPNRLRLFTRLCDGGPATTSQLSEALPVSRQAVTKHLVILEVVGLVRSRRRGRERIWTVRIGPLEEASGYLSELSNRWDRRIDRLKTFVEDVDS